MDIIKPIKVNYSKVEYEVEDDEKLFQNELDKITEQSFADASTTRTIKNIKETLSKHIKKKYNIKDKNELIDKVNKILAIHGMSDEYFDPMQRFSKFTTDKLNDTSVDANANKNELSARGSLKEAETPFDKLIGYDYLYRVMKEIYGQDEAKRLSGEMYDLSLALSDSSCILIPYCYAMDATKLVTIGREFGVLPSKPTHSVDSYIGCLLETIHQLSNHLAGAAAIGSFFLDITHLLIYRHRISLDKIKNDKEVKKFLENKFQHFTHSVNSLSRNGGVESPFTNVSIFDKEKLNTLIADYDWYFPKKVQVLVDNNLGGEDYKLSEEEYKKFIIDYIFEVQKIFVDFFDKGDPSGNGLQYRFPVVTVNLTKKQNENGEYYIDENNELLDFISHKDIARYNIFSSLGTRIASCCRMINDVEMMDLGSTVNSFGGSGGVSLGSHRVVTLDFARMAYEASSYDNYLEILNERVKSAAKILKAHKVLLFKMADMGQEPFIKNGWINMKRMFSTFGVLGLYEAVKILKERFDHKEFHYSKDILEHFSGFCKEAAKEEGIMFNIEQIPAESMAPRLATCDRILFGNPYNLDKIYANQFVPLWEDVTIYEKMDREGEMDHYLTGGSIAHIQIGSDVTPTQAKKIIQYATKAGCEHFALNAVYTKCEDCGNVIKSKEHKCPKCGSENVTQYTRVVGFFTPVSSWNKDRREWEFPRRKFIDITK